jgi:O-antigen/teichoic acid export membrane protein
LSDIKKLAQQTIWYGASTILSRMLGYLLTPLLTTLFVASDFGKITTLFTIAAFLNIIFSFGMETTYFRFLTDQDEKKVFNTAFTTLLFATGIFSVILFFLVEPLSRFIELPDQPEYIIWVLLIVILDNLAVLPFARLRHSGRPVKFAIVKVLNILIQIGLVFFFLVFCKQAAPDSFWAQWYHPSVGVGYVILANLFASAITLLLLTGEWIEYRPKVDKGLWGKMLHYTLPLLIVGFGGMVNDLIDRFMILHFYPGTVTERYTQSGIYSANYKLAIVIALFIQAFRMGAEPFFFKQSTSANAPQLYARVMKFFVITCCVCFLSVVLFLDAWKYFMGNKHPEYWTGLQVVPILMLAKIFLGIYYNLSVWYKLTNRNKTGAWITLGGVVVTIAVNYWLIPVLGYVGCSIATVVCYGGMMTASYWLGQRYFPVPYDVKRILFYILWCIVLFAIHYYLLLFIPQLWLRFFLGFLFLGTFGWWVLKTEKEELRQIPLFSRIIR